MGKPDINKEKGLSDSNALSLVNQFKGEYPVEFDQWVELETNGSGIAQVGDLVVSFIQESCNYTTATDVTMAIMSLRKEINKLARTRY